jgi:hypothetical protein
MSEVAGMNLHHQRGDGFFMDSNYLRYKPASRRGSLWAEPVPLAFEELRGIGAGYSIRKRLPPSSVSKRLLALIGIFVVGCVASGCISSQMTATANRPVDASIEIFARARIEALAIQTLCMFPFNTPPETAAASESLTKAFQNRLEQRSLFRQIKVQLDPVKSDVEALWYARCEGCTFAMCPTLIYMMDGTGNMPTQLVVRIRILDARTGQVVWDAKQSGTSEPGHDIDFVWNTCIGKPAQRCLVLADCLALRFADYLVQSQCDQARLRK